jgi:hypothetical protein
MVVCAKSPRRAEPLAYKARANPSRNQPSSLSRAVHNATPKMLSPATPSSSGGRWSSEVRRALGIPHHGVFQVQVTNARSPRDTESPESTCGSYDDEGPLLPHRAGKTQKKKRDSSHEKLVSAIKFLDAYHVVRQYVTATHELSSSDRIGLTVHHPRCLLRGPDNGKPVERPGRKAPRLQRANSRHASRAAERYLRRST